MVACEASMPKALGSNTRTKQTSTLHKDSRQLKNAGSGRGTLPWGGVHQLFKGRMVSPENTHTRSTVQIIFRNIYVHINAIYMHATTTKKEGMNFREIYGRVSRE